MNDSDKDNISSETLTIFAVGIYTISIIVISLIATIITSSIFKNTTASKIHICFFIFTILIAGLTFFIFKKKISRLVKVLHKPTLFICCIIITTTYFATFGYSIYSMLNPVEQVASDVSSSNDLRETSYEGYINANSFICDDYETLIRLSDAIQNHDDALMKSLAASGKIHGIATRTKAKIIDTGLLDKNAVSVVIQEGKYDLMEGYTFKDWTSKR